MAMGALCKSNLHSVNVELRVEGSHEGISKNVDFLIANFRSHIDANQAVFCGSGHQVRLSRNVVRDSIQINRKIRKNFGQFFARLVWALALSWQADNLLVVGLDSFSKLLKVSLRDGDQASA